MKDLILDVEIDEDGHVVHLRFSIPRTIKDIISSDEAYEKMCEDFRKGKRLPKGVRSYVRRSVEDILGLEKSPYSMSITESE